jgi:hypothetical protein
MNQFKIGDRVRAVKGVSGWFTIGQIGTVEGANERHIFVTFDNGREAPVKADEIELIESEPTTQNPFPTFEEFHEWYRNEQGNMQGVYHYFAQFGVREVFPEVGKEYEFSCSKAIWYKGVFQKYLCTVDGHTDRATHIRPIQPTRLEQLKLKHPNLTDTEQKELLDLLLTQTKVIS